MTVWSRLYTFLKNLDKFIEIYKNLWNFKTLFLASVSQLIHVTFWACNYLPGSSLKLISHDKQWSLWIQSLFSVLDVEKKKNCKREDKWHLPVWPVVTCPRLVQILWDWYQLKACDVGFHSQAVWLSKAILYYQKKA